VIDIEELLESKGNYQETSIKAILNSKTWINKANQKLTFYLLHVVTTNFASMALSYYFSIAAQSHSPVDY
jgi:hypothetical protein